MGDDTQSRQADAVRQAVDAIADRLAEEKEYLTELDSAIGDADHGANMNRGFQAASERVAETDGEPADLVKTAGVALVSEVGGASGPLYGGSLLKASQELQEGITAETTIAFAERYLETVEERGKASVGDKTMIDALMPAVHTYKKSIEVDDCEPIEALGKAVDAARRGVEFTTPIRARKGRASYLGWRSVGHQDPGATSTLYLLEELFDVATEYVPAETVDRESIVDAKADVTPSELADADAAVESDTDTASDGGG